MPTWLAAVLVVWALMAMLLTVLLARSLRALGGPDDGDRPAAGRPHGSR